MSIPNTTKIKRRPTHPGAMLREDFLPDYGLIVSALAEALGVSRQSINELLRERRSISPEMALKRRCRKKILKLLRWRKSGVVLRSKRQSLCEENMKILKNTPNMLSKWDAPKQHAPQPYYKGFL